MLASIHPLGERARHNRWSITVGWYLAGSLAGGLVLGAALGGVVGGGVGGPLVGVPAGPGLVAALCLAGALFDASGRRPPGPRRQVDEDWLARYRGWVYGSGFGFQLGLGVVTIVTTAAVYVTFTLAALSGSAVDGAVIGGAFGLARAVPVLALRGVDRPEQLRRFHARLAGAGRWVSRCTVAALLGAAVGGLR